MPQYITLVCVSLGEYMSGNMKKRFNYLDQRAPLDLVLLPERWIKVVKWHSRIRLLSHQKQFLLLGSETLVLEMEMSKVN